MALFGLPRAVIGRGAAHRPAGLVRRRLPPRVLARAARRRRADPGRWAILVAASPVIAFELAVGGTDVPMVAFLCLGFALPVGQRKPSVLAGLALGVAAAMKATAWPALAVAVALLGGPRRQAGGPRASPLTALGVVAGLRRPVRRAPEGPGGEHDQVPARAGQRHVAGVEPAARPCIAAHLAARRAHGRRGGCSRWPASPSRHRWSSGRRGRCRAQSRCSPGR